MEGTAAALTIAWEWRDTPPVFMGGFRRALISAWFDQYGTLCGECGLPMRFPTRGRKVGGREKRLATIDHIVCIALGGSDELVNLRVICRTCNNEKSHYEYEELHRRIAAGDDRVGPAHRNAVIKARRKLCWEIHQERETPD